MEMSNTEMSEGDWKTAKGLRIEEAREKLRHLMVVEPETVVDFVLGLVESRLSVLKQRLVDLENKQQVLEAHQHKGKAILVPLHLLTHRTMGMELREPQSTTPSWAGIMKG